MGRRDEICNKGSRALGGFGHPPCRYSLSTGCSFKFPVKAGVEESIVNALRITGSGISCLNLTFLHEWCVHNRLFNATFDRKVKVNTPEARFLSSQ
jgi:hypothetical protein